MRKYVGAGLCLVLLLACEELGCEGLSKVEETLAEDLVELTASRQVHSLALAAPPDLQRLQTRFRLRCLERGGIDVVDPQELQNVLTSQREMADPELFEAKTLDQVRRFGGFHGWQHVLTLKVLRRSDYPWGAELILEARLYDILSGQLSAAKVFEAKHRPRWVEYVPLGLLVLLAVVGTIALMVLFSRGKPARELRAYQRWKEARHTALAEAKELVARGLLRTRERSHGLSNNDTTWSKTYLERILFLQRCLESEPQGSLFTHTPGQYRAMLAMGKKVRRRLRLWLHRLELSGSLLSHSTDLEARLNDVFELLEGHEP